jgi:isopentenyl phosphate kinase
MTDGPTILKLGGSVITEKDSPETIDGETLDAVADTIAETAASPPETGPASLVLVHGGGSFGHHHASEHGVTTTEGTHDPAAVLAVHGAMATLNRFVLDRLTTRAVPAVPVHPFSAASRDESATLTLPTDQIATLLDEGFVPVLHGDGVAHATRGVTVLSGDELVTALAEALDASAVGLCSTVPGVLDETDSVIEQIASLDDVADVLGGSDTPDVSGGMAAKVRTLLELDQPASIFAPESLGAFLDGDRPGTTVS